MVPSVSFAPEPTIIPYDVKLNGVNFSLYSQVVETFVTRRGKLGYLTSRTQAPSPKGVLYEKWSMDNALVKGSSHVAMAAKIFVSSLTHNRVSSFPRSNGSIEGSCTHCGNPKHTTYNCFKKNVYPYWWDSFTERKSHEGLDRRNKKEVDKKDGGKVAKHVEVDEPSDIGAESLEPIIGVSVTVEPDISVSPSTPVVPSCSDRYQLPPRITRGHPPNKYSPNNSKTVKYPIAYYVSTDHLPTAIKAFVN
ncbi:hypothetical protein QYF36_023370 [Acer negundo]|nr:hypothetical protein QYF36_023370 [Acer negundo]